jgi:ribosomal protein S18 acetylase RimI-like enzyme
MKLDLKDFPYKRLSANDQYFFDCGDDDINEFFQKDALPHKEELIGVTYFFYEETNREAIGFFTVSNDGIRTDPFKKDLPEGKLYTYYPAVKIGRFGISKKYQHSGFGTQLLTIVKEMFAAENKSGCRYLVVDAYNKSEVLSFYAKSGFTFYSEKDVNRHTRIMKFDLKPVRKLLERVGR